MLSKLTNSPNEAHRAALVGRGLRSDLWLASEGSSSDPSWLEMGIIEMNGSAPDSLIISVAGFMPDPSSSITPALPHHQRLHWPWWIIISGGISNCSSQSLLKIVDERKFSWGHTDIKLFFGAYVFLYEYACTGGFRFIGCCHTQIWGCILAKVYLLTRYSQYLVLIGVVTAKAEK